MKQIIRLTEGDLHKIVKESVNKVLTELDWRTYHNAALKSRAKSNDKDFEAPERAFHQKRSNEFEKYADKKFQDKHGISRFSARRAHNDFNSTLDDLRAGAEVSRNDRGGDEYRDGKWRKK